MQVLAHRHERFDHHPSSDVVLAVGDAFVVSAGPDVLDVLSGLTPPSRELGRYRQGRWEHRPLAIP